MFFTKQLKKPLPVAALMAVLWAGLTLSFVFSGEHEAGKKVYDSKCAMCHGADGKSDTKAGKMTKSPDLTVQPWKHGTSQAEVEKLIREGAGKMPKFEGKLSGEEIEAVAHYVRKLSGVKD